MPLPSPCEWRGCGSLPWESPGRGRLAPATGAGHPPSAVVEQFDLGAISRFELELGGQAGTVNVGQFFAIALHEIEETIRGTAQGPMRPPLLRGVAERFAQRCAVLAGRFIPSQNPGASEAEEEQDVDDDPPVKEATDDEEPLVKMPRTRRDRRQGRP